MRLIFLKEFKYLFAQAFNKLRKGEKSEKYMLLSRL